MIRKDRDGKQKKKGTASTPYSWGETFIKWFSIIGALLIFLAVIPVCPWKVTGSDANLGPGWGATKRYYTLFTATDQYGARRTFANLKTETCNLAQQLGTGTDMISTLVGSVSSAAASSNPGVNPWSLDPRGGVASCGHWKLCKTATVARCAAYTSWLGISIVCLIGLIISVLICLCTWIALAKEFRPFPKKMSKQKQEEGLQSRKMTTAVLATVAFLFSAIASNTWTMYLDSMIQNFQRTSYFPRAALSAGPILCWMAEFFLAWAALFALWRAFCAGGKDKDDDDDNAANVAAYQYQSGHEGASASDWGPPSGPGPGGAGPPGGYQQGFRKDDFGVGGYQQGPSGGYQQGPPGPPPGPPGGRGGAPAQVQYASQYQQGPQGGFSRGPAPQIQYASQYQQGPPGGFGGAGGY